jgi:hypothetical protein
LEWACYWDGSGSGAFCVPADEIAQGTYNYRLDAAGDVDLMKRLMIGLVKPPGHELFSKTYMVMLLFLSFEAPALSSDYSDLRAAAIKKCETIDPSAYQSGLFFNPDGYRSYYVRSECFQRAATQFRDETLCSNVIRRYSLFSSSWGYSEGNCRKLVTEGMAADRKTLENTRREYLLDPVRLLDFRIERNGNGRDFDIIPSFRGSFGHGYVLCFEIIQSGIGNKPIVFHSSGYYLDGKSDIRIFLRQQDIKKRLASFSLNRSYTVRATIVLDVGNGGSAGFWSDAFIERIFPSRERSQAVLKEVRF